LGNAAQNALFAEALVEHIEVRHSIQKRQDVGVRPRMIECLQGVIEIKCLRCQQDQIETWFDLCREDAVGLHLQRAGGRFDGQTLRVNQRFARRAQQESDLDASLDEPSAKVAANTARANNQNLHGCSLKL